MPWYFNAKVSISSFRDTGWCRKSIIFFYSLQIQLFSLAVVFLGLPRGFLASHDPVSQIFLKLLWITLLHFPTVFEIFPIESLSALRNLTISFLSSNDVTDFFSPCLQCKSRCNLVKYPTLYTYSKKFFNNTKWLLNYMDLFNRSDVFDHIFFSNII